MSIFTKLALGLLAGLGSVGATLGGSFGGGSSGFSGSATQVPELSLDAAGLAIALLAGVVFLVSETRKRVAA